MINKIKYRLSVLRNIYPFARGVKRFFFLNLFLSVIAMVLGFINPLFYRMFIDDVIISREFHRMIVVAIGYLGVFFAGVVIGYVRNYANYTMVNTTLYRVKFRIFQNLFAIPFSEYETSSIGDMKMRVDDDTGQLGNFAGYQTIDYLIAYITLLVSVVLLFVIDWRLALFSIAIIPLTLWLDNIISKKEYVLNDGNRENDQKMSAWLHASISGWREIKALNLGRNQERVFIRFAHYYALYFVRWINYWTIRALVLPKIKDEFLMQFGLYFFGGLLIMGGHLRISNLLIFAMYYGILSGALKTVSNTDADLQSNMPFTDRLIEGLQRKDSTKTGDRIIPNDSNVIRLQNVCFAYPDSKDNVLKEFNLIINKGERVAIVGKSGCGKTTVLKLISGMITPTSGSVSFSGVDLREIDLDVMHSKMGFVMQENVLFNTSIKENLQYGRNDATEEELFEACRKAYILDFINTLPDGLNTIIGERGVKLSGGQRQRLVLARMFLRDVDVFIFDEATSALDQYSEDIVHDAIRNIADDKTIIVVAHRESSIGLCDRKITMG